MAKCLVTGGAGFIGSHVNNELLDAGHDTVVLDDLSGGFRENLDPRSTFVQGSICDDVLVDDLFAKHGFERVFHLAAYAAEGLSHFIKRFNYQNNVIGSVNLINASVNHGVDCLVFASSIAVYGEAGTPMRESDHADPTDSYGIAKLTVERELAATHAMFGLPYVVFRPHNVFGELQNIGDFYRNVVGIFINQILGGRPMTIFGDGEQTRAFTYVGDVAPLIARSPEVPGARQEVFNIGADEACTVNQLAWMVRGHMGAPEHPLLHLEERQEVKHAWSDHQKLRSIFGNPPRTDLDTGIRRMVEWARRAGARRGVPFGRIEIEKNLPPIWRPEET